MDDAEVWRIANVAVATYRRTHSVRQSEVDDVMSDACLGAVKGLRSHDPALGTALGPWVYWRAHSEILDGVRRRGPIARSDWRAGVRDSDDLPEHRRAPVSIEGEDWTRQVPDPVDQYEPLEKALDDAALVARLLDRLPARERQVMQRRYLGDEQCQAIAADLGVTGGRVSQLLRSTYAQLRAAA